jgi:methyl-accepting chemotaxis protein
VTSVITSLYNYACGIKIRTFLFLLFGLCSAVMGMQSGIALVTAWRQMRADAEIGVIAVANRDLFDGLQFALTERGPIWIAPDAEAPAEPAILAQVAVYRAKSTPAVEALLATCSRIDCGAADAADKLKRAWDAFVAMRAKTDPMVKVPLSQRPPGMGKIWFDSNIALINELEKISAALSGRIRMADPVIAELIGIKEAAWLVRAAGGSERTHVQRMVVSKTLPADARLAMTGLRGQADAAWKTVAGLAARPGLAPSVVAAVEKARANFFDAYAKTRARVEKAVSDGQPSPLTNLEVMNAANSALEDVVAVCTTALGEIIRHADRQTAAARLHLAANAAGLALALLIGAVGFLFAWRRIATPIAVMSQTMLAMADGHLDIEVPYRARGDEVGVMAGATATLRDNLVRMREMEVEQKEMEAQAIAERRAADERSAAEKTAADARVAAERKTAMHALAGQFEAAVGGIIAMVTTTSTQLEAAAGTLSKTAELTQQLSGTVAAASEEASTNVQAAAASTEEMTSSVNEISRQVQESNRIAREAVEQAGKTDARINELSRAASRIGDVVKLITSVAEQTNLLALNATIEAARAGAAGKGFAVVASEVKALAGQTAKATEEISAQIAGMQTATRESVSAINEISTTIGRISEIAGVIAAAVEEQGAASGEIARNVQQAARGTTEVASNIVDVNRGASETGAASNQVLSSARSLSGESNRLKTEVDRFLATVRAA